MHTAGLRLFASEPVGTQVALPLLPLFLPLSPITCPASTHNCLADPQVEPTVFADVTDEMTIAQEEVGPLR